MNNNNNIDIQNDATHTDISLEFFGFHFGEGTLQSSNGTHMHISNLTDLFMSYVDIVLYLNQT